jgi:environmental stress-induced protein Ves
VSAIPRAIERYDLTQIAAQPWKNGAGLTREIASHLPGAGTAAFDWRISVADVDRDAPFSAFPGIDRCIVLLSGAGMRLVSPDLGVDLRLDRPWTPVCFSGDVALEATLLGGPCRDFNVMTRRDAWRSDVARIDAPALIAGDAPALLLCCAGRWQAALGDGIALAAWQGLLWRDAVEPFHVDRADATGTLLHVRLCHDPKP